jgi:4,5-DOPA dioxygenase extradiol
MRSAIRSSPKAKAIIRPLFISHGAPTLPFEDVAARRFLAGLAGTMPRPRAILAVSAHWETRVPTVNAVEHNPTVHDFSGFPDALYKLSYPAPGDPALASRVIDLLGDAGLATKSDASRGIDHGAWVPLLLAWPEADIPVVQLSVQSHLGPGHHLELGRALAPLAAEDVLIMGSGSFTHDLSSWRGQAGMAEPEWVTSFADWMDAALAEGRTCDLLSYRHLAPNAARNHPTEEHLLPLFVAMGAGSPDAAATRLHTSTTYGVLRMDAYAFAN